MSFSEEHERRAGRRRIAGCGCLVVGLLAFIVIAIAILGLTLGDCGSQNPNCHAAGERTLDHIIIAVVVVCLVIAGWLAWWSSRSSDRE